MAECFIFLNGHHSIGVRYSSLHNDEHSVLVI